MAEAQARAKLVRAAALLRGQDGIRFEGLQRNEFEKDDFTFR
jgi:hypothetical protein